MRTATTTTDCGDTPRLILLIWRWLHAVVLVTMIGVPALSQSADHYPTNLIYPRNPSSGSMDIGAGLSLTILPRLIVEEEVRQLPTIDFRVRYGLPYNLAAELHMNAVYVINQAAAGLSWHSSFQHFSFGVFDYAGLWIGSAGFQGFDTYGLGFLNFPGVRIGVNTDDLFFTLQAEGLYQISQKTVFGHDAVQRFKPHLAGMAYTMAVEQDLYEDHRIYWGGKLIYAVPQYQLWLAFSETNTKLLIPEFFVGYIF